jgi:hypothetical protein
MSVWSKQWKAEYAAAFSIDIADSVAKREEAEHELLLLLR